MGRKFEIRTDHHSLKYLFDQPNLNARQARWLELISEFDFDIKHVKGKENRVANALSRRIHAAYLATTSIYKSDFKDQILEALEFDEYYLQIKEKLQQAGAQQKCKDFSMEEDKILRHKGQVYIPNSGELRKTVLQEMHNVLYVGHLGY